MRGGRCFSLFIAIVFTFGLLCNKLYNDAVKESKIAIEALSGQQSMAIQVGKWRGTIYDRNLSPITYSASKYSLVINPVECDAAVITKLLENENINVDEFSEKLSAREPFIIDVEKLPEEMKGVYPYEVPILLPYNTMMPAVHIIGYADKSLENGISGIEKAYNDFLNAQGGSIKANFAVDGRRIPMPGLGITTIKKGESGVGGVVLTIDLELQKQVEMIAEKNLPYGAVIVADVKTGEILTLVSSPSYDMNKIENYLDSDKGELSNRAFNAYNLGSVFKPIIAAAALESGLADYKTVCSGSVDISGVVFKCHKTSGHGSLNITTAMAQSCNAYFIELSQKIGIDKINEVAKRFGFGEAIELVPGIVSSKGTMPIIYSPYPPAATANLAIGQGELLTTPLQVTRMICAIANEGYMPSLSIVKALGDSNLNLTPCETSAPKQVLHTETANSLKLLLSGVMEYGTGVNAKPDGISVAGKTGTAQTGQLNKDKVEIIHGWTAGFLPIENPKYAIVVFAENVQTATSSSNPVFKEVGNILKNYQG